MYTAGCLWFTIFHAERPTSFIYWARFLKANNNGVNVA